MESFRYLGDTEMLLILTNSTDATADFLQGKLEESSLPYIRFDTDTAIDRTTFTYSKRTPVLTFDAKAFKPSDISTVWYRRPERLISCGIDDTPEGKAMFDEWAEAYEGFLSHIPYTKWMNHPAANSRASRKIHQLTVAQDLGFAIPDTLITQDPEALLSFYREHNRRVIVKPLARAYIERPDREADSLIYTSRLREKDLDDLSDLAECPTLFQQEIQKASDIRITVVDLKIHAVQLIAKDVDGRQMCDIRRDSMRTVEYTSVEIPVLVREQVLALVAFYRLRFAAIDMAVDEHGEWVFFEVNPNGQWAWLDECGVTSIHHSFVETFALATHHHNRGK